MAGDASGEAGLDDLPAGGEIGVVGRQGPEAMHVLRQHDPGIDAEGMPAPGLGDHAAQQVDFAGQQVGAAVMQGDGEEIGAAGDPGSSVAWYWGSSVYPEGFRSVPWPAGG